MTGYELAKRLHETPIDMETQRKRVCRLDPKLYALLRKHKFQAAIVMNTAGNERSDAKDSALDLEGYLEKDKSRKELPKSYVLLPRLYGEHCCRVLFQDGRLVDLDPDPENGESQGWYHEWREAAEKNGVVREITCYFNIDQGNCLPSDLTDSWKELGCPRVFMDGNMEDAILTILTDANGQNIGLAMIWPFDSLTKASQARHQSPTIFVGSSFTASEKPVLLH